MSIALVVEPAHIARCSAASHEYDDDLDDVRCVISDACEVLAASEGGEFRVRAFSDDAWPTDIATDLPTVLEQLPAVMAGLRDGRAFELDFYEQGLERVLHFEPSGQTVAVTWSSRQPAWSPSVSRIEVGRDQLVSMFAGLADQFCRCLQSACPDLAKNPWLRQWASSVRPDS
jgi:hypothetical protein